MTRESISALVAVDVWQARRHVTKIIGAATGARIGRPITIWRER
jgi:hypothetical protein